MSAPVPSARRGGGPLRRLFAHLRPHRRRLSVAAACSVLNKLFDLAPPLLIGAAVDVVVRAEESFLAGWGVVDPADQLGLLVVLTIAIWGAESLFEYLYARLWRGLAQDVQHGLRMEAYDHVQGLEMAWFEERSTGGLMAVLNDDVNQLERFLDVGANELLQVATTVVVIGALFFQLDPTVAWMAMLPMPFVLGGSVWFQRLLEPRYAAVRRKVALLSHQLANNLSGIATIKSFTAERRETRRLATESTDYAEANRHAIALGAAFVPLIRMVIVPGFAAMLFFGGLRTLDGHLEAGAYSVMVFLTQRLLWPLTRLGQTFDLYQRAMASTTRVLDLLATPPAVVDGARALPREEVVGRIVFDAVGFHYTRRRDEAGGAAAELSGPREALPPVLDGLSLSLEAGATTAIVGGTGAGKTTVIKLLLRLYDVTAGAVTLDGVDLRALRLADLRDAIGLVSQDVFLFHGTVAENIAFGRPDASREQIEEAARAAEAHAFIAELPDGYDTIVGERGQRLSGGQRQRLSIARAVLKDPPVLVLDEATSSVDNETEAAIQRSLARLAVGRTTVVIAHRLSTVRHADAIHVLERGRLVESGRHEQLLAADGVYAGLWRVQTGEAVEAEAGWRLPADHARPLGR